MHSLMVETAAPRASMKKRSGVLLLLAVGALCGATYFLSNAHAVPVVGSVAEVQGSLSPDLLEQAMDDMQKGLLAMTSSLDAMKEKFRQSRMVQEAAAQHPEVADILQDEEKLKAEMQLLQRELAVLAKMREAFRDPATKKEAMAKIGAMLTKVQHVLADPNLSALLAPEKARRLASSGLVPQAEGFQAPLKLRASAAKQPAATRPSDVSMFQQGDIGVLPPLGVFDPLGLIETKDMRRFEEMEIKHGRIAMAATLHVIVTEAGIRFPGYLSDGTFGGEPIKFADVPGGTLASMMAIPPLGWAQIVAFFALCDSTEILGIFAQSPDRAPGDVAPDVTFNTPWVRYADDETRTFKLNAERQNGRAAMLGIVGMIIHEALGVDALYPTGGLGGAAPPTIF